MEGDCVVRWWVFVGVDDGGFCGWMVGNCGARCWVIAWINQSLAGYKVNVRLCGLYSSGTTRWMNAWKKQRLWGYIMSDCMATSAIVRLYGRWLWLSRYEARRWELYGWTSNCEAQRCECVATWDIMRVDGRLYCDLMSIWLIDARTCLDNDWHTHINSRSISFSLTKHPRTILWITFPFRVVTLAILCITLGRNIKNESLAVKAKGTQVFFFFLFVTFCLDE